MKFYCRVVPYLLLVVLFAACGLASAATRIQDGDPGTIGACLAQPDGTTITLFSEEVLWRGKSGKSFAVKEWFESRAGNPRLVVVSTGQLPVEGFWSVDVTGILRTFAARDGGTQRVLVVSPSDVLVYCSSNGRPCPFIPVKASGTECPDKLSLTELASSTQSACSYAMLDAGLPPMPDSPDSEPSPPAAGSRDSLKWLPDGAPVSVNGAVVSASFSDYGFFYVERPDRSFGIWVSSTELINAGNLVDITGRMATGGGERAVVAETVTVLDYNTYPLPTEIGMPNKMLGGGPVGQFTLPVSDAAGLNNTGLLVRAWGKVTSVDQENRAFYIDDGSGVASDASHVGVKVHDLTWDPLPDVDSFQTVSGVSAAEWPEGAGSSIRVIWKTSAVAPATQPGSGTVSGTITAAGADGKTVRVYCASASTTATFSGSTANYTLHVPYGDHVVTASLLGYKTTTQLGTVSSSTPVDLDFTLPTISKVIDVVASEPRIAPDGVSEATMTAIVRDEEGRRIGGESITWQVDLGTLVSSDSSTSAVGEATAVVRSSTSHETATVTAHVGSLAGYGWVEYGSPGDPSVLPVSPYMGATLSDDVNVTYWLNDPDNVLGNLYDLQVLVDGEVIGGAMYTDATVEWHTNMCTNGLHGIRARVTDASGNTMYSPVTWVTTDNAIHAVTVSSYEVDPSTGLTTTISAHLKESASWAFTMKDSTGSNTVCSTSGTGTVISYTWDGATPLDDDLFEYSISITSGSNAGKTNGGWVSRGTVPWSQVQVVSAAGADIHYWNQRIQPLYRYAKARGFLARRIPPQLCTYNRLSSIMAYGNCRMLHLFTHCGLVCYGSVGIWKTTIELYSGQTFPADKNGLPGYPRPTIADWNLTDSDQMRFAFLDGCHSGAFGMHTGQLNDMAVAFGMYNYSNRLWGDQTYVGWLDFTFNNAVYQDWIERMIESFHHAGRPLYNAEFLTYWHDPSRFDFIYNNNLVNYGGSYDESYLTTFFEVY